MNITCVILIDIEIIKNKFNKQVQQHAPSP